MVCLVDCFTVLTWKPRWLYVSRWAEIYQLKNPSLRLASLESETKTSQLFLNENRIILINFVITVSYVIVLILANEQTRRQKIFEFVRGEIRSMYFNLPFLLISLLTNAASSFSSISYICFYFLAKCSLKPSASNPLKIVKAYRVWFLNAPKTSSLHEKKKNKNAFPKMEFFIRRWGKIFRKLLREES